MNSATSEVKFPNEIQKMKPLDWWSLKAQESFFVILVDQNARELVIMYGEIIKIKNVDIADQF